MRVDIAVFGDGASPAWPQGEVSRIEASATALAARFDEIARGTADAVLVWDLALGAPDPAIVEQLLAGPADVYHAGLCLGHAGAPRVVEYIEPLWMHGCDAPPDIESTSWRISLRACLVRRSVLEQMRGPCRDFHSFAGAALELGFHWLRRGVFVRHTPLLAGNASRVEPARLDVHDELLFAQRCFGPSWTLWAAARGTLTGAWSSFEATRIAAQSTSWQTPQQRTFRRPPVTPKRTGGERVSVLIPTIERYPYLRAMLDQLTHQTVAPHEVIVVDQTPAADRDDAMQRAFPALPLRWITLDRAGQCSSRNVGLFAATGDHILFVDDDDEVEPDLIQRHLEALSRFDVEVSSGTAREDGIPKLPENFTFTRAADVFPTNNTMIRRRLLERTGLFDLAYDRQPRADADLGMRAHLAGAFMVLNPEIELLHHHAPRGGLRKHGARAITYASSRSALWQRHLPSASELYLARRYFGEGSAREVMWQRTLGTFSSHGDLFQRVAKRAAGAMLLPDTLKKLRDIERTAQQMVAQRQAIPELPALR